MPCHGSTTFLKARRPRERPFGDTVTPADISTTAIFGGSDDLRTSFLPRQLLPRTRRSSTAAHGGLITGADNRYSTGKVVAVAWTVLVAWMVVTEAYIAAALSKPFSDQLDGPSDLCFVFLGGPYAAAAIALASTQTKILQGTLTKTAADSPAPLDVIADDNGNIDVYDFQYTLFNLVALAIVAFSFIGHPSESLPKIPQFLAILTGGAALTYTVNKTISTDGPQITSVMPARARIGDIITITGVRLAPVAAGSAMPTVYNRLN